MKLSLRESIRRQIKKSLNEWYGQRYHWVQKKKANIKEMEEFHRKENETYDEYFERMWKKPGDKHPKSPQYDDWEYEGSFNEAWNQYWEWKEEENKKEEAKRAAKKAAEEQERKKKEQEMYDSKKPLFDKEIEKLKEVPFYDQAIRELEGKNYDETLLDVVICNKNKKAGNSLERWHDGFLFFSSSGVKKVFRSLHYYKPDTTEGHYASLCISRNVGGNHYQGRAYETFYIKKYYVNKPPDYKTYSESLPDDYYHSQRE